MDRVTTAFVGCRPKTVPSRASSRDNDESDDDYDTVDGAPPQCRRDNLFSQTSSYSKDGSAGNSRRKYLDSLTSFASEDLSLPTCSTLPEDELFKHVFETEYQRDKEEEEMAEKEKERKKEEQRLHQILEELRSKTAEQKGRVGEKQKKKTRLETEKDDLEQRYVCSVDLENPVTRAFLPCRHLVACGECAPKLKCCPLCRKEIRSIIHVNIKTLNTPLRLRRPPKPKIPQPHLLKSSENKLQDVSDEKWITSIVPSSSSESSGKNPSGKADMSSLERSPSSVPDVGIEKPSKEPSGIISDLSFGKENKPSKKAPKGKKRRRGPPQPKCPRNAAISQKT